MPTSGKHYPAKLFDRPYPQMKGIPTSMRTICNGIVTKKIVAGMAASNNTSIHLV